MLGGAADRIPAKATVAAGVTLALWASAFIGIRFAGREFSPGALSLGRLLVGSVALGIIVLVRRERLISRHDVPLMLVSGVLWFGVYNVSLNAAEQRVDAGTAALLVNLGPLLIVVLAGWLLREGFSRTLVVGCVVAFAGVALIAMGTSGRAPRAGVGTILCLVAAFGYAAGVVSQKPLLSRASPLAVTWLACTTGAVVCLPFVPDLISEVSSAPASAVTSLVYLGLGPTAIAFTTWAYALTHSDAGRLGATTYLVPPLVVLLSALLLGEVPPLLALPGGLLCIGGVVLARRKPPAVR